MAFSPLAKTQPLCFWQFGFITVNLTVILNFICVKMTMNSDYDSVVGVILPVENKILPIVHLILKLTKTHPLLYTFCQKHSGCIFASGKNGSTP